MVQAVKLENSREREHNLKLQLKHESETPKVAAAVVVVVVVGRGRRRRRRRRRRTNNGLMKTVRHVESPAVRRSEGPACSSAIRAISPGLLIGLEALLDVQLIL